MKTILRFAICLSLLLPLLSSDARAQSSKKYALLVGINEYDHDKLPKLDYAVNDAVKLGDLLKKHGYEVRVLTDKSGDKPTKKNIEIALDETLEKFRKGDTVVIGYAGHGLQFGKDCYFCPQNGKPFADETQTLVSLTEVYKRLEKTYSGVKLVMVDACRDDGTRGIRGGADDAPQPPKGVGVLLSCLDGEKASESDELKHGVFFYHVIKGLEGAARDPDEAVVTWDSLRSYVKKQVPKDALKLFPNMRKQHPNEIGNLSGVPVLVSLSGEAKVDPKVELKEPKPGEERIFDVGNGVKMTFCWIPGSNGKFKIGSPKAEQDYITKTHYDGKRPEFLDRENETEVAGVDGFWMAKYEMTQAQYVKLTGEKNPSSFSADGNSKESVNGKNTDDFPVECVSWNDAQACIKGMKIPQGMKKIGLPSEAQWEWACRGGLGNGRAFYFGDILNGDKANSDGRYPYGTETEGTYLERTEKVGSYEAKAAHPWGLCDMHGNVWEWCEDYYGDYNKLPGGKNPVQTIKQSDDRRVLRGGSFVELSFDCRSSFRRDFAPDIKIGHNGFRVVVLP